MWELITVGVLAALVTPLLIGAIFIYLLSDDES